LARKNFEEVFEMTEIVENPQFPSTGSMSDNATDIARELIDMLNKRIKEKVEALREKDQKYNETLDSSYDEMTPVVRALYAECIALDREIRELVEFLEIFVSDDLVQQTQEK